MSTSFVTLHLLVSEIALFTTMFTVGVFIEKYVHGHLCPYRNVWPEAIYCCFTITILFTDM